MKSATLGTGTLEIEVTNISKHGIWVLVDDEEIFMPFVNFPWFKKAPLEAVLNIQRLSSEHLCWPDLDIDLTLDSVRHPDKYPLVAKG
ncbi:MAG TPA: DUF2442 domain-containing protein [bacterium]|jgi:hypothetical protein